MKKNSKKVKLIISVFYFFALFSFSTVKAEQLLNLGITQGVASTSISTWPDIPDITNYMSFCINTIDHCVAIPGLNNDIPVAGGTDWGETWATGLISYLKVYTTGDVYTGDYYKMYLVLDSPYHGHWYNTDLDGDPINIPTNTTTITTSIPEGTVATSTTFSLGAIGYLNPNDLASTTILKITDYSANSKWGNNTEVALNAWEYGTNTGLPKTWQINITTSGDFNISTTTDYSNSEQIGKHNLKLEIQKANKDRTWWNALWTPDLITVYSTTTTYIIKEKSIGDLQQESMDATTLALATSTVGQVHCGITNFDLGDCTYSLLIPTQQQITDTFAIVKDNALNRFPLGYVTSLVTILRDTTEKDIPVIDLEVPEGIPGAGTNLYLSISSISWIFNATSTFGTSAMKNKTLYQIVNPYYEIVVYLSLFIYIATRLLGAYVIFNEVGEREDLIADREYYNSKALAKHRK